MNSEVDVPAELKSIDRALFDKWFDERYAAMKKQEEEQAVGRLALIATKGTMDMAYPPFILASTAAALDWEVSVFFTFYGLDLLKKDLDLEVSPLGNPAMPMKMPFGPDWFKDVNWPIPNILMSNVPGFEKLATSLMKQTVESKGVASITDLRDVCIESGVELVACQMTVDLFGHKKEDFIPDISQWVGAATFLPYARKSDVCLFI